ncbi:probable serine/threonine-protein kinase PBL18 [Juglans microcarpa x Juglans regia]|uniref:probable serine/threonine-protein kinase PBL18 n=1 Tax=Juglans microcarpa x Juglans regia TaxID=2249226 RepID=UPI001B7DB63F|nr:probable serine/threonine-protein kinase PBL18 [Juglans microcarpa x Juglans regia]
MGFIGDCMKRSIDPNQPAQIAESSNEKHSKDEKHVYPIFTPRDWSLMKVNRMDRLLHACKLIRFGFSVLKAATKKFSSKNLIGQGGFGDVYIGYISYCSMSAAKPGAGNAVAVKRLRKTGAQGHNEWLNELKFLSRLDHPNIVKLIGYCLEGENRILVYEYVTGGSLEARLFKENDAELNWSRRIKIAVGAARGLAYLHTHGRSIIHRDVKSSNVLLEDDFNPKLSDFGLARYGPQDDQSHISSRVLGTRGYFAPEYFAKGHLTLKTDIYSFGVVLLEIFSGCGAIENHSDGMVGDLVEWAKPYLSNKQCIIDKRLGNNFPREGAQKFVKIILRCLNSDPKGRPTMSEVVADLERLVQYTGSCNQNKLRTSISPAKNFGKRKGCFFS